MSRSTAGRCKRSRGYAQLNLRLITERRLFLYSGWREMAVFCTQGADDLGLPQSVHGICSRGAADLVEVRWLRTGLFDSSLFFMYPQ
jgi:hypothetical protein